MHDYSDWTRKEYLLSKLMLDPQNPRLSPQTKPRSQRQIAAELVEHDDVYEVAKNIVTHGYFPNEDPIIVIEGGEPVVVEGNRRVAALKLINEPNFIEQPQAAKFEPLHHAANLKLVRKPWILIAPSRAAALPIMASRHTENQIQRWKPLMQAGFYAQKLLPGEAISDAAIRLKIGAGELASYIRMYRMYEVVCALPLEPAQLKVVHNPREFPISNLERLYEMKDVRSWLGFQFDDRGAIAGSVEPAEFTKGLTYLTTAILDPKVGSSRDFNKKEEVNKFLAAAPAAVTPNLKKSGKFTGESIVASAPKNIPPAVLPPKKKGKRAPSFKSLALIPAAIECKMNNRRVTELYKDLRGVHVGAFPNAVATTLRSLIEFTVRIYLRNIGELDVMREQARAKALQEGKPAPTKEWDSLANMLKHIAGSEKAMPYIQHRKAFHKFGTASGSSGLGVLADLHQFTHNENWHPSEDELRKIWSLIEEPMRYIWNL